MYTTKLGEGGLNPSQTLLASMYFSFECESFHNCDNFIFTGHLATMETLLKNGADCTTGDHEKRGPLHQGTIMIHVLFYLFIYLFIYF